MSSDVTRRKGQSGKIEIVHCGAVVPRYKAIEKVKFTLPKCLRDQLKR